MELCIMACNRLTHAIYSTSPPHKSTVALCSFSGNLKLKTRNLDRC